MVTEPINYTPVRWKALALNGYGYVSDFRYFKDNFFNMSSVDPARFPSAIHSTLTDLEMNRPDTVICKTSLQKYTVEHIPIFALSGSLVLMFKDHAILFTFVHRTNEK